MKQQYIVRIIQMLALALVALFVGAPQASAGSKWDRCINRMNSRGDKLPDAKGRHCWDSDDDDCCNGSKKSNGKKSSRNKDDGEKK
jgi:hypothetical protein